MTLVSPSHSFQFLKGTIKTTFYDDEDHFGDVFQSLIGTIKTPKTAKYQGICDARLNERFAIIQGLDL